jgi:hypothetical protein
MGALRASGVGNALKKRGAGWPGSGIPVPARQGVLSTGGAPMLTLV